MFPNAILHVKSASGSNKKLSWCWQTCATRMEVSQSHQT